MLSSRGASSCDFVSIFVSLLCLASLAPVEAHSHRRPASVKRANSSAALNPQLTNTQQNAFPLYYNGSGPVPGYNLTSPAPTPITPFSQNDALEAIWEEINGIISNNNTFGDGCNKCVGITEVMHITAITQPVSTVTNLLIRLCHALPDRIKIAASACESEFSGIGGLGAYYAQLFAKQSSATGDFRAFCTLYMDECDLPPVVRIDESQYFSPKPPSASIVPKPSNQTISVLHFSDWHIDPRFDIGSEANCSQSLCCRPYSTNTVLGTSVNHPNLPASRFGSLLCDSPADLALSALNDMNQFFDPSKLAFTIFTGDIVSNDLDDQLSRTYVEYVENNTYQTFKAHMGNVPILPTLGNHDSLPNSYNTPNSFNAPDGNAFSWNYNLVSSLWQQDGWINSTEAQYASTHYGGYAHTTKEGLRVISLNSDFWFTDNIFNYYNFSNPDISGSMAWLAKELEACEQKGQRAWIIAHVLTGYDGSNALPNPSALFHSIVVRFSPATIAAVFFGHTHEEQYQIFYDFAAGSLSSGGGNNSSSSGNSTSSSSRLRNVTQIDYSKPLQVGYVGPSITPFRGLNAGYVLLDIDAVTFSVVGSTTYFANMSESLTWPASGPVWRKEYDIRTAYTPPNANNPWPRNAPLNATFFDGLTRAMQSNGSLVDEYNLFETKSSVLTPSCSTAACRAQKICYIRSGNAAVGRACQANAGPA